MPIDSCHCKSITAHLRWATAAVCIAASCASANAADFAFFETKIRPVLVEHCYACHSAEAEKHGKLKGGLLLDSRAGMLKGGDSGPAIVPGTPAESLLISAVKYVDFEMPPAGRLSAAVVADLEKWIADGAPDPRDEPLARIKRGLTINEGRKFWSFVPPRASSPPAIERVDWPAVDLDRFVAAARERKGYTTVGDADPRTLIRRLYFDLIGLPPTPEEVEEFVADISPETDRDRRSRLYEQLVDKLLASPHFGERWGRHWLDVARYADSNGRDRNMLFFHAWRYRNYVIDSFNADKPYDQFIREQIAGDLLPVADDARRNELRIATGLLSLGPKPFEEKNLDKFRMEVVDEQIELVGRSVLGLSLGCARCHDHKFDPIPTGDYYALAGIFRSTETLYGYGPKGARGIDHLHGTLQAVGPEAAALADSGNAYFARLQQLAKTMYDGKANRYVAMSRLTAARLKLEQAGDDRPALEADISRLADEVTAYDARIRHDEAAYEAAKDESPPQPDWAMAVRDRPLPEDCPIHVRGETTNLGATVPRGVLQVIPRGNAAPFHAGQSGRLELAAWLTSRDNPLTARVMANRVWLHLFGRGFVSTPDDFGTMGAAPSHPELLDHLALQFMEDGWSVKRLIRYIVLSRTYRQAGGDAENAAFVRQRETDPDNIYLWRMPPRRMEVEIFRDAVRSFAGTLDRTPPTPEQEFLARFNPYREEEYLSYRAPFTPANIDHRFRSVYLPVVRGVLPESYQLFDFASPERASSQRDESIVPTQALYLMNGPWIEEQACAAAERFLADDLWAPRQRIEVVYRAAFQRNPTKQEVARVLAYLCDTTDPQQLRRRWIDLCHAAICSAEFRYVR